MRIPCEPADGGHCATRGGSLSHYAGHCRPRSTHCAAHARSRGSSGRSQRDGAGGRQQDDDVVLFDLDSGWNVEALKGAEGLLDDLEDWQVEAVSAEGLGGLEGHSTGVGDDDGGLLDGEEFEEESEEFGEFEDEVGGEGMVWSVRQLGPAKPAAGGGGKRDAGNVLLARSAELRGTGGAERDLLASLPRHVIRQLAALQAEADQENAKTTPTALRKARARQRTHRGGLKIISGSAAGRQLLSPQGDQTRPMMELVRGAVFNMIMSMHGCTGGMPEGSRWLDLFAGTGAVGIEALSRGCAEAHFVELSPWVVSNCLAPNLEGVGLHDAAVVHVTKAEEFLRRAAALPRFAGGAFDFVSVCPPYELVSYPELYELLEASALLHEESIVLVEYPKRLSEQILPRLGPLVKLRDRRYGRTLVALYGPGDGEEVEERVT